MMEYKLGTALIQEQATAVLLVGSEVFTLDEAYRNAGFDRAPASILEVLNDWRRQSKLLASAVNKPMQKAGRSPGELRFLSPVTRPPKVICVGVNYRDHLAEMKVAELPAFPYAFMRPHTCLAAHQEEIALPRGPQMVDWEAELGIVVGERVRRGDKSAAPGAIAGFTIINDVSARDWIASRPPVGIDWVMQKAWDQFQPTGPWITPAQFVPNPGKLALELTVNDEVKQKSNTDQMIFGVTEIMSHLAAIMTLEPGDLIATGTPAGVGFGRKPQEFLRVGDQVRVTIEKLGELENRFVAG